MNYNLGRVVSKGYADVVILDLNKSVVEEDFQLDDNFGGHLKLYEVLMDFLRNICRHSYLQR